jgi:hypothetical protein
MPEQDQPQEVAPVETGFSELAVQQSAPPTLAEVHDAAQSILDAAKAEEDRAQAERAAVKAAADAEERHAASLRERAEEPADLRSEAQKINDQIHQRILEARTQARKAEEPKPPQPASQHILDQTRREMEAGRKTSEWHRAQQEHARSGRPPPPRPGEVPEGTVAVFRPNDYVPDQVRGQGYIKVTS